MLGICIFLSFAMTRAQDMEGFIVGGSPAAIDDYPHSTFLTVTCFANRMLLNWICGASLLNQRILLTAGHCIDPCGLGTHITVNLGSENREKGIIRSASAFVLHENYYEDSNNCDIALVKMTKPVKFTSKIRRVAIMKSPPYNEPAKLSGWGNINEYTLEQGYKLLEIKQKVWERSNCEKLFFLMPKGTICASSIKPKKSYAAAGDSGAALMVRDYIQVGLVSYKTPGQAVNVVVYTDIGYYYEWIRFNAPRLYCTSG